MFRNRVVLADASALRFGITVLGEEPTPDQATYFLMPHFPVLRMPLREDIEELFQMRGVMERGNIFSGVHLSVPNAVGAGVRYAAEYDVASITSYVEHYAYSPEVVLGGSAAVYFDVFSATMSSCPEADHAIDVTATIETDGAPELLATPFFGGTPLRIPLTALGQDPDETVELLVANQGMDCETQENHFDFLLHLPHQPHWNPAPPDAADAGDASGSEVVLSTDTMLRHSISPPSTIPRSSTRHAFVQTAFSQRAGVIAREWAFP